MYRYDPYLPRSNRPDNEASMRTENVSWKAGFDESRMDVANIGLTSAFPSEYRRRNDKTNDWGD